MVVREGQQTRVRCEGTSKGCKLPGSQSGVARSETCPSARFQFPSHAVSHRPRVAGIKLYLYSAEIFDVIDLPN